MEFPDYPFTSHYADINGHKMHYLDEGPRDAEPVVMLHGNPSWSFYYRKLVLALRDRYRCIVPDHIGMGLSEKPLAGDYDFLFPQRADDLTRLLDMLGVKENITMVLHDWGGMIGMTYAFPVSDRIKRLVILNTAAFQLPPKKKLPVSLKVSRISLINMILIQGFNAFCRGAVKYCVTRQPMPMDIAAAYIAPYDSWASRLAVRRFVQDIPLKAGQPGYITVSHVASRLNRFQSVPMLIAWGMQDFVFDETFLHEWINRFPAAEVHRFTDAGHYILEDAAEEVIPLIADFLKRNPFKTMATEDAKKTENADKWSKYKQLT
jgi:cis-3-alkyl-4-acyloxetan-2-one decarboxylase